MSDVNGVMGAIVEGARDTASFSGTNTPLLVSGTFAATELGDSASFTGKAPGRDRTPVVRGSSMVWSAQVAIVDAMDALDVVDPSLTIEQARGKRQPVIYPFNRGGRKGFVAPLDPYQ